MNYTDPTGQFAFIPVITTILAGYGVLSGIENAVDMYYDYLSYKEYDRYIQHLRDELNKTKSCDLERYEYLSKALEKAVLEQTRLAVKRGVLTYSDIWEKVIGMARF